MRFYFIQPFELRLPPGLVIDLEQFDVAAADDVQRTRALLGLLADGLVVGSPDDGYELPS